LGREVLKFRPCSIDIVKLEAGLATVEYADCLHSGIFTLMHVGLERVILGFFGELEAFKGVRLF